MAFPEHALKTAIHLSEFLLLSCTYVTAKKQVQLGVRVLFFILHLSCLFSKQRFKIISLNKKTLDAEMFTHLFTSGSFRLMIETIAKNRFMSDYICTKTSFI